MIINYHDDSSIYNVIVVSEDQKNFAEFMQIMSQSFPKINMLFSNNYFDVFDGMILNKFDLIIIDVDCTNGKNFLFKIDDKGYTNGVSMILLGSDTKEEAKINAIDCGFDEYICKTPDNNDLASRIRVLLRKIKKKNVLENKQILRVGDITMNVLIRTVTICNRGAKISTKEFNILKLFLENPDKVFSRKEILEKIWENSEELSVRIVDVHINRLRIALGSNRSNRSYIRTVRGYGYSLDVYDCEYRDIKKDSYNDIMSGMSNNSGFNYHNESYNNILNKFLHPNNV